jgi:hypothetical protein
MDKYVHVWYNGRRGAEREPATRSDPGDPAMTELKTNSKGMTRLLVSIHQADRERLAQAARLSGASQQSILRNALARMLASILDDPRARTASEPRNQPRDAKVRRSRARKGTGNGAT